MTACRPKIKNNVKRFILRFFHPEMNIASKKYFLIQIGTDITKYMNIKIRAIKCYKKELENHLTQDQLKQ